ncbi:MAG TPA: hypothetical protein VNI54_08960 [Thermoanaerobaculia bacterium]|nr:hypothetical protein [Thermoanaerobaculia bacterium]
MKFRKALPAAFLVLLAATGCTGGSESKAADEKTAQAAEAAEARAQVDASGAITNINPAIPLYEGARYRDDLTRRDEVMIRNRFGSDAKVYTLATDDSYPQVYHYYTTYLAQFRAFPSQETYPSENEEWRKFEVSLNQVMQDSFIPGESLDPNGQQVLLQIAETESEPKTVIRYIVTPRPVAAPPAPVATAAANGVPAAPVAR